MTSQQETMQRGGAPDPPGAWVAISEPRPAARARLFCLPYAGGGTRVFRGWAACLPPEVELCAVQLPGRERRIREPAVPDVDVLVARLLEGLTPYFDRPFALFGHSMGGLLAHELAQALRAAGRPQPGHIFVAGARAPHAQRAHAPIAELPEDELVAALVALEGTPPGVLDHPELRALVLPTLRADFRLVESFGLRAPRPLPVPLTVFAGTRDRRVTRERARPWEACTSAAFAWHEVDGDHFFIEKQRDVFLTLLAGEVRQWLGACP